MRHYFVLVIYLFLFGFLQTNFFQELDAATMSASADAPIVDGLDIANYDSSTGSDKWWAGNSSAGMTIGQTFTTGTAVSYTHLTLPPNREV